MAGKTSPRSIVKILILIGFALWPLATIALGIFTFFGMLGEARSLGDGTYELNGAQSSMGMLFTMAVVAASCFTTPVAFFGLGFLSILAFIVPGSPQSRNH